MKKYSRIFPYSLIHTDDLIKLKNEVFDRGMKYGRETAINKLTDHQQYSCINLTDDEREEVLAYLKQNNLEFGYDVNSGGFYILKNKDKDE